MNELKRPIRGIIFDYGATIDSNGVHWAEIIWQGYCCAGIKCDKESFRKAYVFAERALAVNPYIMPHHNFLDLMSIKIDIELRYLHEELGIGSTAEDAETIALYCYNSARESVMRAKPLLEEFHKKYKMVLVSNFYGNIESVLADFTILPLFRDRIVESAVVGVRKPDPEIFAMGVRMMEERPENIVVVGDSYTKDIAPASTLGCQTIWIKGAGWDDKESAISHPFEITDFKQLANLL